MRKIILFIFLVYTAKSFALSVTDLKGCFKTIDVNGTRPAPGPISWRNQSLFEEFDSYTYKTTDTNQYLDIYVLSLFQGYSDPYYSYNPFVLFKDKADKLIEEDGYLFYEVDTDVYMSRSGLYSKVDHYVRLEVKEFGNELVGSAEFKSIQRKYNRRVNFTLRKEDCLSQD
ncbi:hypothetical protein [Bacteriovorax sp. Seq25_V]|uniref:hypothetical protein n=1 Tax=Bacteriovorax sp. Seq25_V TaxID=1201288 RepID=UPI000389FF57|nr:hypothetical protein [Bacteriovorax sp. Seq25_V]EQC46220.1 hypothetical protein M900_1638 [Bacteriovorax sp. Seq25_V]